MKFYFKTIHEKKMNDTFKSVPISIDTTISFAQGLPFNLTCSSLMKSLKNANNLK